MKRSEKWKEPAVGLKKQDFIDHLVRRNLNLAKCAVLCGVPPYKITQIMRDDFG